MVPLVKFPLCEEVYGRRVVDALGTSGLHIVLVRDFFKGNRSSERRRRSWVHLRSLVISFAVFAGGDGGTHAPRVPGASVPARRLAVTAWRREALTELGTRAPVRAVQNRAVRLLGTHTVGIFGPTIPADSSKVAAGVLLPFALAECVSRLAIGAGGDHAWAFALTLGTADLRAAGLEVECM